MSLKERISKDYMVAFKARDTVSKNILSVIKGEIQTIEKNKGVDTLCDDEVTKILNKNVKSLKENFDDESLLQLSIVEGYLPCKLTRDEISDIVINLKNKGITSISMIMKEFSTLPVDRKVVSEVIKELID